MISELPKSRLIQPLADAASFSCAYREASEGIGSSLLGVEAPGLSAAPERIQIFFKRSVIFFFSVHFLPSVSLRQVLVEARESYSGFGISRSLIFYFAVAGAL